MSHSASVALARRQVDHWRAGSPTMLQQVLELAGHIAARMQQALCRIGRCPSLIAWLLLGCGLALTAGPAQAQRFIAPAHLSYPDEGSALAGFHRGDFVRLGHSPVAYGYGEGAVWLVVVPDHTWPERGPLFLTIDPVPVSKVTLWHAKPTGELVELGRNGMAVPSPERSTRNRLATLLVPEVREVSGLLVLKVEPITVRLVGVTLRDAKSQQHWVIAESIGVGLAVCLMLCLFGMALFIYILLERRVWIGTSLALILVCSLLVAVNGVMPAFLEAVFVGYFTESLLLLATFTIIVYSLGTMPNFAKSEDFPRSTFWARLSIWMVLPAALAGYLWGHSGLAWLVIAHAIQAPVMVVLGAWGLWAGDARARSYALHGAYLLGSLFWLYIGLSGWIPFQMNHWVLWQVALALAYSLWMFDLLTTAWRERQANARERDALNKLLELEKQQLTVRVDERTAELRDALSELQRLEAHQRELLSLASHEFRTPAALIKSALGVLARLPGDYPEAAQTRLETIRAASNRLTFLANKLIEHDRWREMSVKAQKTALDLRAWMLEVMSDFPPEADIATDAGDVPVHVEGDPVLLRIALQNLVDNALIQTKANEGIVTVALTASETEAIVAVEDDGPGVPDALKAKVFERFFSARKTQRHGLGLSIVRSIARMHGGDAVVEDAPGRGARFVIRLPLHALSKD